jgi:hypothetical protein
MRLSRLAAPALVALVAVPATPALADQTIAELGRQSPIATHHGWVAWSRFDQDSGRYALTLRAADGDVKAAPVQTSDRPFDVSLGPDRNGHVVAIYQRCASGDCDVSTLDVSSGATTTLRAVSSPAFDEATPAIFRSTVVFTRRIGGCDVPYVKDLRSSAAPRRLLTGKCLQTAAGHVSISGSRIVISSVDLSKADRHGAGPKTSELRRYSSRTSGSRVIASLRFGEESKLYGQVAQDNRFAYTVRTGIHGPNAFVRVPWSGGRPQEARAFRTLGDGFAKPSENGSLYVESQEAGGAPCDGSDEVPCRLVSSPRIPFVGAQRTLSPRLTIGYAGQPRRGQPLTFSGKLAKQVYSSNSVVGTRPVATKPLAGVSVELYHRTGSNPERFEPTGLKAATAADGSYSIVLPEVGADLLYTAVAATPDVPTWAGRGTVGSVAR